MDSPLTLVTSDTMEKTPSPIVASWRELPVTDDMLFRGTDERGRSGWFCRLSVGGLLPRRVGPFRTKSEAREVLDEFLADVKLELFLNVLNDMRGHQVCVVEG